MAYKSEREWSDFAKADKIVMAIFVAAFLGISVGLIRDNQARRLPYRIIKIETVRGR